MIASEREFCIYCKGKLEINEPRFHQECKKLMNESIWRMNLEKIIREEIHPELKEVVKYEIAYRICCIDDCKQLGNKELESILRRDEYRTEKIKKYCKIEIPGIKKYSWLFIVCEDHFHQETIFSIKAKLSFTIPKNLPIYQHYITYCYIINDYFKNHEYSQLSIDGAFSFFLDKRFIDQEGNHIVKVSPTKHSKQLFIKTIGGKKHKELFKSSMNHRQSNERLFGDFIVCLVQNNYENSDKYRFSRFRKISGMKKVSGVHPRRLNAIERWLKFAHKGIEIKINWSKVKYIVKVSFLRYGGYDYYFEDYNWFPDILIDKIWFVRVKLNSTFGLGFYYPTSRGSV